MTEAYYLCTQKEVDGKRKLQVIDTVIANDNRSYVDIRARAQSLAANGVLVALVVMINPSMATAGHKECYHVAYRSQPDVVTFYDLWEQGGQKFSEGLKVRA